jgi:hypothetical protein
MILENVRRAPKGSVAVRRVFAAVISTHPLPSRESLQGEAAFL